MSLPPQVPKNGFNENRDALEDKEELASVEIGNRSDDAGGRDRAPEPLFVSSIRKDEPIVTKIELWSYYRQSLFLFLLNFAVVLSLIISFKVYYNGDNVCRKYILFPKLSRLKDCSK